MHRGDSIKCFECGEPGHVKANCPKKKDDDERDHGQPNPLHIPPKDGEPHTRTEKGNTKTLCKHCRQWTTGARMHLTEEHVVGYKKEGESKADDSSTLTERGNFGGIDTPPKPHVAAGNLALIPFGSSGFGNIGGFLGAFGSPSFSTGALMRASKPPDSLPPIAASPTLHA
jgi:hypothetical protein